MARYRCPRCEGANLWEMSDGRRRCAGCRYTFDPRGRERSLTPFWKHRLTEYFALGVPAYRLRFRVPLSQPTILRFYRELRERIYADAMAELEKLSGTLEMDESAFGGKHHGKRGWGAAGKTLVFGIYKRNGKVRTFPVESRRASVLLPLIEEHTAQGSLYFTDDWQAYASLSQTGTHVTVQKEKGRPKGRDHVNGIEGFWGYAKNWLYVYRGFRREHFPLFLKEVEWRFNHRDEDLVPLLKKLLQGPLT